METLSEFFGGFDHAPLAGGTDEWRFMLAIAATSEIGVAREEIVT